MLWRQLLLYLKVLFKLLKLLKTESPCAKIRLGVSSVSKINPITNDDNDMPTRI